MSGVILHNRIGRKQKKPKRPGLNFYQRVIDSVFRPMRRGRLKMILSDGRELSYGRGGDGVRAEVRVRDNNFFRQCVLFGDVGFGESYVNGEWDSDNVTAVIEWMIDNVEDHPTLMDTTGKKKPVNLFRFINNLLSFFRKNTPLGSRQNISAHYDLGNEFYRLFLDPSMTYSSAYFLSKDMGLYEAQIQKYERLCRKLKLEPSDRVLEIGSGWGGFAEYAARNYGCHVTTVTISREQHRYVLNRVRENNLESTVEARFCDYRDIQGKFDKIVSIEMIEAVGHQYYGTYFQKIHELLEKDGILAIQAILSPDHRFESFKRNMDFIQKHIFPGSLLPSVSEIHKAVNRTGDLNLLDYEDMTAHYARTLNFWHQDFVSKLDNVRRLGFDETFVRKWTYYLNYCEAAFKTRNIYVAQAVYARPNNRRLSQRAL